MRPRKLALALLAATALLAGCGDDDDSADEAVEDPTETTDGTSPDAGSALDDDVAAVVDGDEISAASIAGYVEGFTANPQIAEQLEGADGEDLRTGLRANILSSVIRSNVLAAAAEDIDAAVTDEDIAAARTQVEDRSGGAEGLEAAMEQQGLTEDLLRVELRGVAAVENITEALDEEAGDDGTSETSADDVTPDDGLTPSEQRVQEFLLEQLSVAEVRVHPDFGSWDPQSGQVVPPGVVPGG